jgi:hypothetical protein
MNLRIATFGLLTAAAVYSQPTIAPTDAPVGPRRGEDFNGYNVTNSFEVGYRWRDVNGNLGKYRSDVNYGNGLRLLGSSLSVHSKEGHGGYFDELLLNTQGLGNDPYQFSSFRIQKNSLYRYDMIWRENAYYNPALPIANGQHLMDTSRRLQDHQIVLLPQAAFKVFAGYSRNTQSGAALSTVNLFDQQRGDEFPLFTNVRRLQDEYRLGAEIQVAGVKFMFQRGWEVFRDDTRFTAGPTPGNNLTDRTALMDFRRDEPYHGSTASWRAHLIADRSKLYNLNGRFTYAGTRRNFLYDELALGTDRLGSARNRQVFVFGNGRRPVLAANLTATLSPSEALTVVNHTAFHHTRMDGDGSFTELNNGTGFGSLLHFQFLGIRTFTNSTDLNYRFSSAVGAFGGYQFSTRRIRSIEQLNFGDPIPDREQGEQNNHLHAGRFGLRLRPVKPFTVILDGEIGRTNRPVYPTSERNYHLLGGRALYRTRTLTLGALVRTNYNFNSTSLLAHSAKTRTYSADASWTALSWLGLDTSYSKLHLDTLSGIAYFFNNALVRGDESRYISNIHAASFNARVSPWARVELMGGYTRIQDTGSDEPALGRLGFQVYPLTFSSPMARVSVRLRQSLRWNAGYQRYGYGEQWLPAQNYRAHTGYTSLSWSF